MSAQYNLEEWIFKQIKIKEHMRILDIGCGTGKQILALDKVLRNSHIIGIDNSKEAVDIVNQCKGTDRRNKISAVQSEMDDVIEIFSKQQFDLILSSYAIYYAKDMCKLVSNLPKLLKSKGEAFICGYGNRTNWELSDLIQRLVPQKNKIEYVDDFIREKEVEKIASYFSGHTIERLNNYIDFHSVDQILSWWRHHNSFIPTLEPDVHEALTKHFQENIFFRLSKNVLGLLYSMERINP